MRKCLKLLPALFCLLHAAEPEFDERLRAAVELEKLGDYRCAERALLALLKDNAGLGPDDPRRGVVVHRLGSVYHWQGKYLESEASYREAIRVWRSRGSDEIALAQSTRSLAALYLETGHTARAGRLGLDEIATRLEATQPQSTALAGIEGTLGTLALVQGQWGQAETYYRRAVALWEKLAPNDEERPELLTNLGLLYYRAGRYAEAQQTYEQALALDEKLLGTGHPEEARVLVNLGAVAFKTQGPAEAIPFYQRAIAIGERSLGAEHPVVGRVLVEYAFVLRQAKRKAEAKRCQRRGEEILMAAAQHDGRNYTIDVAELRRP